MTDVFVNGAFVPEADAKVSVFDRGFLFADGIYEVWAVLEAKPVDVTPHLERLERSCGEIRMVVPMTRPELTHMLAELCRRNGVVEGMVYLQITRGVAPRDFAFPKDAKPTVVAFTQAFDLVRSIKGTKGAAVVTIPDIRWKRRDIKSVALLAQVLARQAAVDAGAAEAWMVADDGFVTEGAASNAYIVKDGALITRALSNDILHGTTRRRLLVLAEELGVRVEERPFTVAEALAADEAFSTGAASLVTPAIAIDGKAIGDGAPGPITTQLRERYIAWLREDARRS